MKLNKNLKIWLALSTISILILLFWTNRPMESIPFLIKNEAHFKQVADEYSEKVLAEIKGRTEAYPEYYDYYKMAKSADSLAKDNFENVVDVDFEIQQKYIVDSLLNPLAKNHEYLREEIRDLGIHLYDYSNKELAENQLQDWSLNLIKSTTIQRNTIALLNYYEEKTGGSYGWSFYDNAVPILYKNTTCALVNENYQFQIGMSSYSNRLRNVRWWINDEATKVRDGKTWYQERATKSGWNTLKIKYQGEYQKQIYTDSLTYRYYVCD